MKLQKMTEAEKAEESKPKKRTGKIKHIEVKGKGPAKSLGIPCEFECGRDAQWQDPEYGYVCEVCLKHGSRQQVEDDADAEEYHERTGEATGMGDSPAD